MSRFHFLDEEFLQGVDTAGHGAAGRILVPAAPEFLRDGGDVDVALGAQAHTVALAFVLLEEHHRLDFLHGKRQVDEPLGVFVGAARLPGHLVIEIDDGDAAVGVELHGAQHGAEQLQAPHVVAVVDVSCDHTGSTPASIAGGRCRRCAARCWSNETIRCP